MSQKSLGILGVLLAAGVITGLVVGQERAPAPGPAVAEGQITSEAAKRPLRSVLVRPLRSTDAPTTNDSPSESNNDGATSAVSDDSGPSTLSTVTTDGPPLLSPPATGPALTQPETADSATRDASSFSLGDHVTTQQSPDAFPIRSATRPPLGTPSAGTSSDPSVKPRVVLSSQAPQLRFETKGPEAIVIGREADYEVSLINDGAAAAEGVKVRVALPSRVHVVRARTDMGPVRAQDDGQGQQSIVWTAASIQPGERERLILTVKATDGHPFDLSVDWTVKPTTAVTQIQVQQPRLEVVMFGPEEVRYGKPAVFTVQVTNPGTGAAENVVVEFSYGNHRLPPKEIGVLAAGEQTEIQVELSPAEAGLLELAAQATGAGGLRSDAKHQLLVRRARLAIEIVGPPEGFAGMPVQYVVRLVNTGDATATRVATDVFLPRGAQLTASPDGVEPTQNGLRWQVDSLSPGAERTIEIPCVLTVGGTNQLEVQSFADDDLATAQAFITEVKAFADLKLIVNDPPGPTPVGGRGVYELIVVNRGSKAAEHVRVVAQFSNGIEPVEAHGQPAEIVPGQVLFESIGRINPGEERLLKVIAQADQAGMHRFRAEVTCSEPETKLVAEDSTYYFESSGSQTTQRSSEGI